VGEKSVWRCVVDKIGEKIRSLRIAKRMTQTELAGDQITRNMLSLIENGSALPSLQTVMYLSDRLSVPAGMLLARENEELIYRKMSELSRIKARYNAGEYKICAAMCEDLIGDSKDDEIDHILSLCHFNIAKEAFNEGKLHTSCMEFDLSCSHSENTIYGSGHLRSAVAIYFEYMMRLSPTLTSDFGYDSFDGEYELSDPFCRYAKALLAYERGDEETVGSFLSEYGEDKTCYVTHIKALDEMSKGDYRTACELLQSIINGNDSDCTVIMYDIFKNLEACCREIGDYKGAYEYSVGKMELLEHMLVETGL
jgi:transcriptional regulator with XRE-family HTH domain